jgi:hypothetical protein
LSTNRLVEPIITSTKKVRSQAPTSEVASTAMRIGSVMMRSPALENSRTIANGNATSPRIGTDETWVAA